MMDIKWIIKQYLYLTHGLSTFILMGVIGINYKFGFGVSVIFQIVYSIILTMLLSSLVVILISFRMYTLPPNERVRISALFSEASKVKKIIIDLRIAFSLIGLMIGIFFGSKLSDFLNITVGSGLDWFILIVSAIIGGLYGYYSLISLDKAYEGWAKFPS